MGGATARARMNRGGGRARRNNGACQAVAPECKVVDDAEASVKVRRTITKDSELSVSKRGGQVSPAEGREDNGAWADESLIFCHLDESKSAVNDRALSLLQVRLSGAVARQRARAPLA